MDIPLSDIKTPLLSGDPAQYSTESETQQKLEQLITEGSIDELNEFISNSSNSFSKIIANTFILHKVVEVGNAEKLEILLDYFSSSLSQSHKENIAEISRLLSKKKSGKTILHLAVDRKNWKIIKFLVETEINELIVCKDSDENTAFHNLLTSLKKEAVKDWEKNIIVLSGLFINYYKNSETINSLNLQNKKGEHVIHYAAELGNSFVLRDILEVHPNIKAKTKAGCTPLHLAAKNGHYSCVKILLSFAGDEKNRVQYMNCKNKNGRTALSFAAENGLRMTCDMLTKTDATIKDRNGLTPLFYAAKGDKYNCFELLLHQLTPNLECQTIDKQIIKKEEREIKRELNTLKKKINNIRNEEEKYKSEIDTNSSKFNLDDHNNKMKSFHKRTSMLESQYVSCQEDCDKLKQMFSIAEKNQNILLDETSQDCGEEKFKLLQDYKKGEHILQKLFEDKRKNLLHTVVENKSTKCLTLLLNINEFLDSISSDVCGSTLFHKAIKYKAYKIALQLIEADSSLQFIMNLNKEYPLHMIAKHEAAEASNPLKSLQETLMDILLEKPKDIVNHFTKDGNSLLHLCAESNNCYLLIPLLKLKCDITARNEKGMIPLQVAAKAKKNEVMKKILRCMSKSLRKEFLDDIKKTAVEVINQKNLVRLEIIATEVNDIMYEKQDDKKTLIEIAWKSKWYDGFFYLVLNTKRVSTSEVQSENISGLVHTACKESLRKKNRDELEQIIASDWWDAAFDNKYCSSSETENLESPCKNFQQLISCDQVLAILLLDKLVKKDNMYHVWLFEQFYYYKLSDRQDLGCNSNLMKLDSPFDDNHCLREEAKEFSSVRPNLVHPLLCASTEKHYDILKHPTVNIWLKYKMKMYTRYLLLLHMLWRLGFIIIVVLFFGNLRTSVHIENRCGSDISQEELCLHSFQDLNDSSCFKNSSSTRFCDCMCAIYSTTKGYENGTCNTLLIFSHAIQTITYEILLILMTIISLSSFMYCLSCNIRRTIDVIKHLFKKNPTSKNLVSQGGNLESGKYNSNNQGEQTENLNSDEKFWNPRALITQTADTLESIYYIWRDDLTISKFAQIIGLIIVLIPSNLCSFMFGFRNVFQWECAVIVVLLSFVNFIHALNRVPLFRVFVPITRSHFTLFLTIIMYLFIIVYAFSLVFSALLPDDVAFSSSFSSFIKSFTWMLGDLAYDNTFVQSKTPVAHTVLTQLLYVAFVSILAGFIFFLIESLLAQDLTQKKSHAEDELADVTLRTQLYFDRRFPSLRRKYSRSQIDLNEL